MLTYSVDSSNHFESFYKNNESNMADPGLSLASYSVNAERSVEQVFTSRKYRRQLFLSHHYIAKLWQTHDCGLRLHGVLNTSYLAVFQTYPWRTVHPSYSTPSWASSTRCATSPPPLCKPSRATTFLFYLSTGS